MISIAVCDDENYMLKELQQKISSFMQSSHLEYSIQLFQSSEGLLYKNMHFDIIFLDIKMDRMNGMEAARLIRQKDEKSFIVFVTALKELVYEAFEVQASNYLLKPVDDVKLAETLSRIIKQSADRDTQYLSIRKGAAFWQIRLSDIYYCEVIKRKIFVYLAEETIDYYDSIENLNCALPSDFFQCHRSYIINLNYVKGYENNNAVLSDGTNIPVSRLRRQDFSLAVLNFAKNRRK